MLWSHILNLSIKILLQWLGFLTKIAIGTFNLPADGPGKGVATYHSDPETQIVQTTRKRRDNGRYWNKLSSFNPKLHNVSALAINRSPRAPDRSATHFSRRCSIFLLLPYLPIYETAL